MNCRGARQDAIDPQPTERPEPQVPSAILVVEDEPEILAPLSYALKQAGYIVFEAEDGLTACRMIGSQQPDLVLLDIMLPDLDGWEVCRMLRQHPDQQIATTPVIMLTALNSPQNKLRGLELGADAYLPKPYSQQELLLMSSKLIERHRRGLELARKCTQLSLEIEQQRELQSLLFHELRNQLTVLHGYTQLLQDDAGAAADSRLAAINRSSDYLQGLAEDFLLIRQMQGSGLHLPAEPLALHSVAAELLELYLPSAGRRGISLQLRIDGTAQPVQANLPAFKIVLSALLDNAIKYGPPQRPVTVFCRFGKGRFDVEVCDEGTGIPAAEREQVFNRFFRGAHGQGEAPGSGLGLYGVRVLAEAMGGGAEIEDGPRCGCCARVWLPLAMPRLRSQG